MPNKYDYELKNYNSICVLVYRGFEIKKNAGGFFTIEHSALSLTSVKVAMKCIDVYLKSINYELSHQNIY